MELNNKIMLITYSDSMGKDLKELHEVLNKHYKNAVGGVHILPFFPSSADRGFAPMCYDKVDENFGTFEDIEKLGKDYYLMFLCKNQLTYNIIASIIRINVPICSPVEVNFCALFIS